MTYYNTNENELIPPAGPILIDEEAFRVLGDEGEIYTKTPIDEIAELLEEIPKEEPFPKFMELPKSKRRVESMPILIYPNKALSKKCSHVDVIDERVKTFALNMYYTMRVNSGIGIAAPQVGSTMRIIAVHVTEPVIMINPVIVASSDKKFEINEGSLSMPNYFQAMSRSEEMSVMYQDIDENPKIATLTGLQAACVQHEIDHLNWKTLVDYLPFSKRLALRFRAIRGK